MIRLGNVISISKAAAIQTAGLATVFFIVFMASFTNSVAHDKDLTIHENTRIRNVINFDPSLTATDSEIALAEVSGDRVAEAEYGANVDVISPEAELLIDIDKTLGGEIGIACVDSYVNVRTSPDASAEATAKVYDGAVVFVQEREGEWCKIKSGNAEGYVMSQYFMFGNQLAQSILISEPYTREELLVDKSYTVGITLEEEEEIRLAKEEEERKERARIAAEQEAARKKAMEAGNANSYEDASQLRKDLCDFACQYVGLKYVNGGNSLESTTITEDWYHMRKPSRVMSSSTVRTAYVHMLQSTSETVRLSTQPIHVRTRISVMQHTTPSWVLRISLTNYSIRNELLRLFRSKSFDE